MGYRKVYFPDGTVRHVLDGAASIRIQRQTDLKVSMTIPTEAMATFETDDYRIVPDGDGWQAVLVSNETGS